MPDRIVELLEAYQVEHQQREPLVAVDQLRKRAVETAAVGRPGQAIGECILSRSLVEACDIDHRQYVRRDRLDAGQVERRQ